MNLLMKTWKLTLVTGAENHGHKQFRILEQNIYAQLQQQTLIYFCSGD